ncbi:hypothetical protein LguiA_026686 [Lonicera macranthoides]
MEDQTARRNLSLVLVRSTTSFHSLPASLVANILSRLPVKTLITSTSVNKSWYAFIKNPKFIHLKHSIKNGNQYLLLAPTCASTKSCSLINEKNYIEESKFEIPFQSGSIHIYSSCNGLVCLGDGFPLHLGQDLHLWNPSVKKHKHIQSSCYADLLKDCLKNHGVIGFGFHEDDNDYRIVRIIFRADDTANFFGGLAPWVEVYRLRSDTWRRVTANVPRLTDNNSWVFVNGSVYWLEAKRDNSSEWIVSFDFKNEVFGEFKLPRNFRHGVGKGANVVILEFKGSVSVCAFELTGDYGGSQRCSVWVRRENGGSISWVEQFKVVLKVLGWPLMFTKSGKLILQTLTNLVLCDLEELKFKELGNDGLYTGDASFVESFVLFEGGNSPFKHSKLAGHGSF